MQLSHESYRARWLLLVSVWVLAAATLFFQSRLVRTYLDTAGNLGLRGAATANTPLKQAFPSFAADGQVWTRHALSLIEGDSVRLRHTTIDNAPYGREVHWNSAWAWTIATAGRIQHLFTGEPIPTAVERATLWLNPAVMFLMVVLLSAWATTRGGAIAGIVVAITMTCHDRIFEGFFPSYVDHHGLLSVAVVGLSLGAVFMGAGWWQPSDPNSPSVLPKSPESARRSAMFSALSGACGLWVSAASIIPPIAIIGLSGVIAIVVQGRSAASQGAQFDPDTWRTWGRFGAGASLFFYLVEYFPNHMGFRLEPNHPVHALAWLGGGELIAQFGEHWLSRRPLLALDWRKLIWPLVAVSMAPLVLAIGRDKVFTLIDPFLATLHRDYIQEFLPIWKTLRSFDAQAVFQSVIVGCSPLIAAILTLSYRRRASPIILWFATIAGCVFMTMACWQSRWLLNFTGIQIGLVLVLVSVWTATFRPAWRWGFALFLASLLFVPNAVTRYVGAISDLKARRVSPKDALAALNRDIAATLRGSQPTGDIVLLSSPNGSVGVGYYGRFKTLGTLYWENNDGLKSAAAILGARDDREAATLIRAHGVTHVAIISEENFISEYYKLLHPQASLAETKKCFGARVLLDRQVPQWLQMIPYRVPDDLASLKVVVMLFKVNFKQNLAEAIYNVALTQISQDALEDADKTLEILTAQAAHNYQPWLRRAELQMLRMNWAQATEFYLKGIALAPKHERAALTISAASTLYSRKQHALAIKLYRAALADQFVPEIASFLAWILATSEDVSVRNGKQALELAEAVLKTDPNSPSYLNVLAAALAETGRFADAVTVAERSVANARLRGEAAAIPPFEARLQVLKSGKPLRQ
jgi:tetratricopeptide (TPR) repeat protein